jgi:cytochrome c553
VPAVGPKRQLKTLVATLRRHYVTCWACAKTALPCAEGAKLWDQAAAQQVKVVRACVTWHAAHFKGVDRAEVLIGKMVRVVDLMTNESERGRKR